VREESEKRKEARGGSKMRDSSLSTGNGVWVGVFIVGRRDPKLFSGCMGVEGAKELREESEKS